MCDKANYKTVSSSATVREPEFFIKACLNKLAKLVFGHDNNYLESMRLRVWGCIFFSTLDRTERRSSDNTSRNAEDASVWWTPGKVMSVKTAWIHTCTVQQATVVWVSWVRFTTSSMRGENPAPRVNACACLSMLDVSRGPTAYLRKFPTGLIVKVIVNTRRGSGAELLN